ncbi:MAG TPA: GNAT family N-acetyltransferase [Terriglobales bacterium]|nr:GNAT family N-acetyltransferase [Terriglobales bacterium]
MRRLRTATCARELEALRPLWQSLERSPGATVFQSYLWNLAAARHLRGRERPHVIALETDCGAAIVPAAFCGGGGVTFLGEMLFDYRDVLTAGDPRVLDLALAELGKAGRQLWLPAVREDATLALGRREPWVGAPVLRRARTTPERFRQDHYRGRKQRKRLERAGATFERYQGDAATLLDWVYRRKASQFAGSGLDVLSDAARRACMLEICSRSGPRCEVFTIELGSSVVAALVTFREPEVRRLYTVWHDPAREDLSPGIVLFLHVAQLSLEEGLDVDFLTGEQPYKARLTNDRVQLYRLRATAAELLGAERALPLAA